jgi:hypothetical protein
MEINRPKWTKKTTAHLLPALAIQDIDRKQMGPPASHESVGSRLGSQCPFEAQAWYKSKSVVCLCW